MEVFTRRASVARKSDTPALRVEGLRAEGVQGAGFALAPGEILGVAGLEGQGQSRLFKTLAGLQPARRGTIEVAGQAVRLTSPRHARSLGLVLVPEERKSEGLFPDLSTAANISLPVVDRASRFRLIDRAAERRLVDTVTGKVNLAANYLSFGIGALSGGNQQKAILARALLTSPKCLLLFDPTRGVDVGAKQNIYAMMRAFAEEGGAILFYSTELDEIVGICDRALVLYKGAVAADLPREELSQERILSLASGASRRDAAEATP